MSTLMDQTLTIQDQKQALRKEIKSKLDELVKNKADFYARQGALIEKVEASPEFKKAKTILLYYPFADELDLSSLIISNVDKRFALPRPIGGGIMLLFEAGDLFNLIECKFGVKAPPATNQLIQTSDLDLVIVPALCFDKKGFRLGRGGGYYDRLLSKLKSKCKTIGVAFSELVVDELPLESHDIAVNRLIVV